MVQDGGVMVCGYFLGTFWGSEYEVLNVTAYLSIVANLSIPAWPLCDA